MQACHFCSSSQHLSQNCDIYPTLRSRFAKLNYRFALCLCKDEQTNVFKDLYIGSFLCSSYCEVCLQEHHISLCPQRDPTHPFFSKQLPESLNLFNLDYLVHKRFLTLCNPIDKLKLRQTCKYLNQLQPLEYKVHRSVGQPYFHENTIGDEKAIIIKDHDMEWLKKHIYFNYGTFFVKDKLISKSDLLILSRSDPFYVNFENCKFDDGLNFYDFLQSFSYALGFVFTCNMLPSTWIKDFVEAKRSVNLRKLEIASDFVLKMNANEIIELLEAHKDLVLTFSIKNLIAGVSVIEKMMKHKKFSYTTDIQRCHVKFISLVYNLKLLYHFTSENDNVEK